MADGVYVKDSDMISAKSILGLLSASIEGMKIQLTEDKNLTENTKAALSGAVEALTDLHNMILKEINEQRNAEAFAQSKKGKFDA